MIQASIRYAADGRVMRRKRSCHGSDCNLGEHRIRDGRCVVFTRVDWPGARRSEVWVSGDLREGRAYRQKRRAVAYDQPASFGGGFLAGGDHPAAGGPAVTTVAEREGAPSKGTLGAQCFVLGCRESVRRAVWTGEPLPLGHPRFGRVAACKGHGKGLEIWRG